MKGFTTFCCLLNENQKRCLLKLLNGIALERCQLHEVSVWGGDAEPMVTKLSMKQLERERSRVEGGTRDNLNQRDKNKTLRVAHEKREMCLKKGQARQSLIEIDGQMHQ